MKRVVLVQLPVPQSNFGRQTGNVPLAAACLSRSAASLDRVHVEILPESMVSYLADAALTDRILSRKPEIVGFSVYCWNLDRSLHMAGQLKEQMPVRIIFGGPEITPDNPRLAEAPVDFLVYGEGEAVFKRLLSDSRFWLQRQAHGTSDGFFESSPSPYLGGVLEPEFGNVMLLETQRGCPFQCGYCYYNKSRRGLAFAKEPLLLEAIDWALQQSIGEVNLLDPCLSARPGLKSFLEEIAVRNRPRRTGFVSEIRGESVDESLADLFQAAGFLWFEIGLQSTNPVALDIMNRRTDLNKFLNGARLLRDRGISPRIDLILGLPGDNLAGFQKSVDFIVDHDLTGDVQVFPLSVLPGTDFRKRSRALGLNFTSAPPYSVIETPTFSGEEMGLAIDYAETCFNVSLYPFPLPDIAWRKPGNRKAEDVFVGIGSKNACAKLYLDSARTSDEIRNIAKNLTYPYQIFVDCGFSDHENLCRLLSVLTVANPFTPFEIVFLSPSRLPTRDQLLSAIRLSRPQFMDIEQRFLFRDTGNRSVIFTLVSETTKRQFTGEMERQLFWWKRPELPAQQELSDLFHLDGVLIDSPLPEETLVHWQDEMAPTADNIPHVAFADLALQTRWLLKTNAGQYAESLLRTLA